MYNEKIENLIKFALADGELTEKEKQILFKKAEEAGIDLDEFEMVLDAKLHEMQQSTKQPIAPTTPAPPTAAPKSDKFGDVKKCPACGAIVQSFSGKCGDCGYEFRDIQSDVTINKLFEALMDADNIPKDEYRQINRSGGGLLDSVFGDDSDDDEEQRIDEHDEKHLQKVQARKIQVISNFPVPNAKEPLLEFLTLGISKATPIKKAFWGTLTSAEKDHNALVPAWKSKLDQIVMKAKMSMKEDKSLLAEIDNMINQLNSKK